jgi:hypothetical protein
MTRDEIKHSPFTAGWRYTWIKGGVQCVMSMWPINTRKVKGRRIS